MSLRAYLAIMGFATVLSAATLALVIFRIDPFTASAMGRGLFYLSLFFTVSGIVSIVGFLIRVLTNKGEMLSRLVSLSFRQAVLLSALATGALALLAAHLLSWWNSLLLVGATTAIEFVLISLEQKQNKNS